MIVNADSRFIPLADNSVQCVVTSPPYYGLRDYGVSGQIGLEQTPEQYIENIVNVSRELWRVMKDDGVYWLNLGDSYNGSGKGGNSEGSAHTKQKTNNGSLLDRPTRLESYKPKDLMTIPARVAIALQADGWYLRAEIVWAKPNPMPESVTDRPTRSHEMIYLLTKQARYFYDAEAVKELSSGWNGSKFDDARDLEVRPNTGRGPRNIKGNMSERGVTRTTEGLNLKTSEEKTKEYRNQRDVWSLSTESYSGAHYATFPTEIPRRAIKAGSCKGDIILDPFCGSGTTGQVARELGRRFIGLDLSMKYLLENALPRAERKTAAHVIASLPLFAPEAA